MYPTTTMLDAAIRRWLREPDWAAFRQTYNNLMVLDHERNTSVPITRYTRQAVTEFCPDFNRVLFYRYLHETGRLEA